MNFPHYITVRRSGSNNTNPPGQQDPDEGTWSEDKDVPGESVVTKGRADVQDVGVVVNRTDLGEPIRIANATAFFRTESKAKLCRPDDVVTIEWNDGQPNSVAKIIEIRRLDGSLVLARV